MQQRAGEKIEHDTEEKTEQTDTKADAGGSSTALFKEVKLNRGRPMAIASQDD